MLLPVIQYPLKYFLDACYPIDDIPCGTQCSNPCPTHPMCVNRPTVRYSGAMTVGIDENELIVYGGVRYSPKYEVLSDLCSFDIHKNDSTLRTSTTVIIYPH